MGSRVLGLVREQVFAAFFGAGKELDAFNIAFRVPNLLRDLFAEGALSAAFVTTFCQEPWRAGRAARPGASPTWWTTPCPRPLSDRHLRDRPRPGRLVRALRSTRAARRPTRAVSALNVDLTVQLTRIMFPFLLWCRSRRWPWACSTPRTASASRPRPRPSSTSGRSAAGWPAPRARPRLRHRA